MKKKKQKIKDKEFTKVFKRKAGAHAHKLDKRRKTREKKNKIETE